MAESPIHLARPVTGRPNLWPLGLVVLILGCAMFGDRGIVHMLQLSGQKAVLAEKISGLETRNDELRKEIEALRGDRRYIERLARTELGMVRDDELVFQFSGRP